MDCPAILQKESTGYEQIAQHFRQPLTGRLARRKYVKTTIRKPVILSEGERNHFYQ
jgi:hypothetical protein